jgi:hypothetical protein
MSPTEAPQGAPLLPSSGPRRVRRRPRAGLLTLGLALLLGWSCRAAPPPREYLETGFRTPEQTIRTFQVGMRADLPGLEFQCLAVEFVERYRLSELAYREFRQASGWLRYGVARARIEGSQDLGPDRRRLELVTSGPLRTFRRRFVVDLVRETFWEVWAGEERVADELAGGLEELFGVEDGSSGPLLLAVLELPFHLDPRAGAQPITGIRIGQEWKIADIRSNELPTPPPAQAPGRPAVAPPPSP